MNWKYKIKIKDQFEDETTPELIVKLSGSLATQLKIIKNRVEKNENDMLSYELEMNIDNFEHLGRLASGDIKEEAWEDFNFYGDFEGEFNGYLSQLYDLGDEYLTNNEKFLWIG